VADFCLIAEGTGFGIVWIDPGKAHFKVTVYSDQPRYYAPYLPRPTGIADAPNAIIRATAVIQAFEEWAYEYQQRNTYKGDSGTVRPLTRPGSGTAHPWPSWPRPFGRVYWQARSPQPWLVAAPTKLSTRAA
jgi:hypothetical protein